MLTNVVMPILGLVVVLMIIMDMSVVVNAADPDPLVDIPTNNQFVLRNLLLNGDVTRDTGGIRAAVNTTNLPLTM